MLWHRAFPLAAIIAIGGGALVPANATESPPRRQVRVNGAELLYLDQGTGAPIVFVHGSFADHRFWEPQRQALAQEYRFIAYTRRYHGTAPWADHGEHYSAATHTADLVAFLRQLNGGPVHLVALSYGGLLATLVALDHPELLRSLTVAEPIIPALLANLPEGKSALDDQGKTVAAVRGAVTAGDAGQAIKLYFEAANNQGAGALDKQPEAVRRMILDNARTVPLMIAAPPPPAVSCAALGGLKLPILVVGGEQTARFYSLINEAVVRCTPGSRLVRIPQATHWMSSQNPTAFNEALLQFLAQH